MIIFDHAITDTLMQEKVEEKSDPKLGISAAFGEVVYEKGDDQKDERPESSRNKHIPVADGMDTLSPDHRDQGGGPARGVECLGDMHDGYGGCHGNRRSEPDMIMEGVVARHADKGGKDVPPEEIPRLGQRASDSSVYENRRGSEGADHKGQIRPFKDITIDDPHRRDPDEGP